MGQYERVISSDHRPKVFDQNTVEVSSPNQYNSIPGVEEDFETI